MMEDGTSLLVRNFSLEKKANRILKCAPIYEGVHKCTTSEKHVPSVAKAPHAAGNTLGLMGLST